MADAFKLTIEGVTPIIDPTTGSGKIYLLPEAMGQKGRPFGFLVDDPPNKTRPRHYHHGDVLYVYTKGEHHIEGEGTYGAGDIRWTRAGHVYGPETTGPEGGAWWVISYSDPIPVDMIADGDVASAHGAPRVISGQLPAFARPYDWQAIDETVKSLGGAILTGFLSDDDVGEINKDVDDYLAQHPETGRPASGSSSYDIFLGHRTVRLHGLVEKMPTTAALIGHDELLDCAERILDAKASSILLNAGELIQIGPGEPAQFLHRDSDSWPAVAIEENPVIINAIIALDPFTLENGATYIAPGSWEWDRHRQPKDSELVRAVMARGDAVLFRADLMHGGGENESSAPRRAISISYCAGWLRPVENSFLNVSIETARAVPERLQAILGYAAHDAVGQRGGMLGLFENGDPQRWLETAKS
ncbi:MAG: phytanoyl-CoA dioxygenase family protein [Sphingomonas sp.]